MNPKEELLSELWRLYPHTFAQKASGGVWRPYPYLKMISDKIADAIANGGGRIIVELPARHGKSTLISKWTPAWYLDLYPDRNVILATYEADFAAQWGKQVRNELMSNPYATVKVSADSSSAARWNTLQGGGMVCAGVGGPITGRGGNLIIVDDPVKNMEEACSLTMQKRNIEWFQSTLLTRCEPGATVVVLMTRWHENDLAGWLHKNFPTDWTVIRLPAIAEEDDPLGRSLGDALCPERYDTSALADIKKQVGSRVFTAMYQQSPVADGGNIIKPAGFKYFNQRPTQFHEMIQSWDLAFTATSSYVVGQVWGRIGADIYLLDQVRDRLDFLATKRAVQAMSQKWPQATAKLVENKANGPALISALKGEIFGIKPIEPEGSKENRAMAISPLVEAGNVHLPSPIIAPWIDDFITEVQSFPNGANDDQMDAMTQALRHFQQQPYRSGHDDDMPPIIIGPSGVKSSHNAIVCSSDGFPEDSWQDVDQYNNPFGWQQ